MGPAIVALRKDLARSLRQGHPWIYRDALRTPPPLPDGGLVTVRGRDGRPLVWGFWDATSPIAAGGSGPAPAIAPERGVRAGVAEALARRRARLDPARTNAFRWVHGEGDHL